MKNLTDVEIIESVKKGNQADYSILIDRYKNKAFTMLKRMLKNDFDAEDLTQETFIRAYRFIDQFEPGSNCKAWLFRIMKNLFINFNKKKIGYSSKRLLFLR